MDGIATVAKTDDFIPHLMAEVRIRLEYGQYPELQGAIVNRYGVFRVPGATAKIYIAGNRFTITCFPPDRAPINAGAYVPTTFDEVRARAESVIDQLEAQLEWVPLVFPAIPVWDGWIGV